MKILIAPDSFKNALSALGVANSIKKGLLKALPGTEIMIVPMADGGEGTVESLIDATDGKLSSVRVHDPLMREVDSFFGITGDGNTAVIEMAAASGIHLINSEERDPWITTTRGTGQLIRAALDEGCRTILLGIGGSATNDCGTGMARALGVKFLGPEGRPVKEGGGALGDVRRIDISGLDQRIRDTNILVACDVTNPLTGPNGASRVYAPQKGADDAMVKKLDRNLADFAGTIRDQIGKDVENVPGAGAAGGLGAGLIAFLDAKLVEGVPAIAERIGLEEKIK
ncbi:MAG: glycerate kinase, partial [Bacteroidales bacterium]|nr:glycerate kinase [Bacteroidales bacterium]